ncbi:gfo/Idh/MocA family oxidoreductase [Zobellella taiwanensis]|uniref:Gfo/Idh/MocA family oxidoreductase n=1 Tax=Zobellella taiwanensis TaxID=347535 RepID=A0A2P7R9W6_9GAMM|nr:Gfo/Idh/MocA family oxidoreductase [Zobellella taiwanensis]PSJ46999.1 gfo/Idh/MocA family oxidoreductase [Zobellella taiwanensis]
MNDFGIAILGAGMIGAAHASGYRAHQSRFQRDGANFQLLTVCDARQEAAEALATNYGFAETATDWRAVIADERVKVVSVTLPNFEHATVARAALAAGKHVLCEKPLALTAAEARDLAELASTAGVNSGTVFNNRRVPAIREIKNLVAAGEIGEPVHILIQYQSEYAADPTLPHSWRYLKDKAGGGALHDIGAHAIDVARFICGDILEIGGAISSTTVPRRFLPAQAAAGHNHVALSNESLPVDTDDVSSCVMRFESGCQGLFSTSRVAVGMGNTLSFALSGTRGTVRYSSARPGEYEIARLDDSPQAFRIISNRPASPYVSERTPVPHDGVGIGFAEVFGFMIAEFMESIAQGQPFTNGSIEDGLRVAEILEAIQLSADEHRPVQISEIRQ